MTDSITNRHEALAFLEQAIDYERTPTANYSGRTYNLRRMAELLSRLGDPHRRVPIVHVAGSKGKGSTAAMVAAMLRAAGHRIGLFTSPHLELVEERLVVDGQACPSEAFTRHVAQLAPVVRRMRDESGMRATYFEMLTALGWLHFASRQVDLAVFEVGMGGRLDSTNVCCPLVTVITSISLDHTAQLGPTTRQIAVEKAGIVKPGIPTISGVLEDQPREAIAQICRQQRSPLFQLGEQIQVAYRPSETLSQLAAGMAPGPAGCADVQLRLEAGQLSEYSNLQLQLRGRHQAQNAALAVCVIELLAQHGWNVPESAIRAGLANVTWPARFEILGQQPLVILDAAHNADSIRVLLETIQEQTRARRRILVFGCSSDKDAAAMLSQLAGTFDTFIATSYQGSRRGLPTDDLAALAMAAGCRDVVVGGHPASARELARQQAGPEDLICVTGSIFLAGELRRMIAPDLPVHGGAARAMEIA